VQNGEEALQYQTLKVETNQGLPQFFLDLNIPVWVDGILDYFNTPNLQNSKYKSRSTIVYNRS
jgi:hypothetical protein